MYNLLWFGISIAIAIPFVLAVQRAKASVEDLFGRKPHGHFHDIPNGTKLLPTWAGVALVFGVLGWKIAIIFFVSTFVINLVATELGNLIHTYHYREKYLKLYMVNSVSYFVACLLAYAAV